MANDEQRKAFAAYMGTPGQQNPQYPGGAANTGQSYLYQVIMTFSSQGDNPDAYSPQQYPGAQVPPAAPSPPTAVQAAALSNAFPQRPPPLGSNITNPVAPSYSGQFGYVQYPRRFTGQSQPIGAYNPSWQYPDPRLAAAQANIAMTGTVAPPNAVRSHPGPVVESTSNHTSQHYHHYQQYEHSPPHPPTEQAHTQSAPVVPVLLCHTCSDCGRMRSVGFHKHNPVIPGRPLVPTLCRKCRKKKMKRHSSTNYTYVRSRTTVRPGDSPAKSSQIEIDHERRGRGRSRETIYMARRSPGPEVLGMSESHARLGVRVLQEGHRSQTKDRNGGEAHQLRHDEVWPPPDVVRMRPSLNEVPPLSNQIPGHIHRDSEVWPPPDVVPTYSHRKARKSSPPPRVRARSTVIELSPSPPPPLECASSTRVVYRSESQAPPQARRRSISPPSIHDRHDRVSSDAASRIASHPRAFRSVDPNHRTSMRETEETSTSTESIVREISPPRGILKHGRAGVTAHTGTSRVQFVPEGPHDSQQTMKMQYMFDGLPVDEDYDHHRYTSYRRSVEERSPSPPIHKMEKLHLRHASPPPLTSYEQLRPRRTRRSSPSPPPGRYENTRIRYVSPPPSPRGRTPHPQTSPRSMARDRYSHRYRSSSRTRAIQRDHSLTPPPRSKQKEKDWDEFTDSESSKSGDLLEVRTWKGIDEEGQPATFVEERRTTRELEPGSGRQTGYTALETETSGGHWRDV